MEIKDIAKFVLNESLNVMLKATKLDEELNEFVAKHTEEELAENEQLEIEFMTMVNKTIEYKATITAYQKVLDKIKEDFVEKGKLQEYEVWYKWRRNRLIHYESMFRRKTLSWKRWDRLLW